MTPSNKNWYLVCASSDLKVGQLKAVEDLEHQMLIYRDQMGKVNCVSRHCPHFGSDLVFGKVQGNKLMCPMHAWEFDSQGKCVHAPGYENANRRLRHFKALEKYGAIFVSISESIDHEPSFFDVEEKDLITRLGKDVNIDCTWDVIAANGYDTNHFKTIHNRFFHVTPKITEMSPSQLQIEIHAGSSGQSIKDKIIRKIGKNSINVRIVNHGGTILTVESKIGFIKVHQLISLYPLGSKTRVRRLFGITSKGIGWLNKLLVYILDRQAYDFLVDDVVALSNMKANSKMLTPDDVHLGQFYAWLQKIS